MFKFFYNREDPINKFTIMLALAGLIVGLVGTFLMLGPAKTIFLKIWQNRPAKIKLIILEPKDCKDCFDIYKMSDFIKDIYKINYSRVKKYKAGNSNADLLIKTHGIKVLPTFVLQGDIKSLNLDQVFDPKNIEKLEDKLFVYANYFPPYYDIEKKEVKGRFNMIYLTDQSCTDCYDVYLHDKALENLIMSPSASSTIDVASDAGKGYVNKYSIKYVPTILMKGDLDIYQNFKKLWESVGTVESDGMYIFREAGLDLMGKYKDIQTGKTIEKKSE